MPNPHLVDALPKTSLTVKDLLEALAGVPQDTPIHIDVPVMPHIVERRPLQHARSEEITPGVFRVVLR